jgi:hypothetical protein
LSIWRGAFPFKSTAWLAWLMVALLLVPAFGRAQGIESVMAPGDLIQGHAKLQDDCKSCHVRFDRKAQDRLCMDCHKEVGQDVRGKLGFHGRIKPQACRDCHTDHKGRDAQIVELDKRKFDHALSDYALRGKHVTTECDKCHLPAKKYREAPSDCNACHRKDDTHKGSLGPKCADCHTESDWKEAKFDHDKTRFQLTGKHVDAKCADCHRNKADYKDTPRNCYGCHKKEDDASKGHKGLYGEKCDSCHGVKSWKPSTFNHDADTKYQLRGKHRTATCASCHTGHLYKVKLSADCNSCHKKDDKHKGSLGTDCTACHTERDWKEKAKFDHDKTDYPLLGKHAEIKCEACHKSTMFKEAPKTCIGCHKADDKHAATLGEKCESCHYERDWKNTKGRFDHDKTEFRLRNAHAAPKVECKACHKDLKSYRKTPKDCYSCHGKDDKHEGQEGRDCVQCHDDASWKVPGFNHTRTRFPLVGRHITTACKECHATPRYKDAARDCYGCHKKDDKHKLTYGVKCESCHNARAWSVWAFDHDRRSTYRLDGAHRKVACDACHSEPAPAGKAIAPVGSNCISCHRKDDIHDGGFGVICEQCHTTENWKKVSNRAGRTSAAPADSVWALASVLGQASRLSRTNSPMSSSGVLQ